VRWSASWDWRAGAHEELKVSETYERPERRALAEVETLVRHATEELTVWRRRCLRAEGELQELRAHAPGGKAPDPVQTRTRLAALEQENVALQQRLAAVRERVTTLASRLAFLERGMTEPV
jgi:chromosome segregation ATPase